MWVELVDAPNEQVVTYLRYSGRAKRSGIEVPPEYFAVVIEVRDRKITRAREYASPLPKVGPAYPGPEGHDSSTKRGSL